MRTWRKALLSTMVGRLWTPFFLSSLVAQYFAVVLSQPVIPSPVSLSRCLSLDHSLFIPLDTQRLSLNVNTSHAIDSSDLVRCPFSDI
jgi:hypothetical protein